MAKKEKKIQDLFDFFLKDFAVDPAPQIILVPFNKQTQTVQEFRLELPEALHVHSPFIVFIMFVYLKGFKFYGKEEKVAWTIPITFKGIPFLLTHRKFGFRIISNYDTEEIRTASMEAMTMIKKATPYADKLFEPFIKEQVGKGKITLDNQSYQIRTRYLFFRKKATNEFRKAGAPKAKIKSTKDAFAEMIAEMVGINNSGVKHSAAGNNYATAMLDSFFCLLEHTYVLLLPFLKHIDMEKINMEKILSENWKQKFKICIPVTGDKEALQLLERLGKIKEELRNPLTHGYFLKDGNSFYVHTLHLGAIPVSLSNRKNQIHYGFYPIHNLNFTNICKCFDDLEKFLKTRKETKFGMLYIERGISIAFDKDSTTHYRKHMTTVKHFKEYLDYETMRHDDASNMDW